MRLLIAIAIVLALSPQRGAEAAGSDAADAMAEAMARMMEAMGLLDADDRPNMPSMPYAMPGMGNFGYGQMPWGQMPWSQFPGYGSFTDPITAFGLQGLADQMPAAGSWPWFAPAANTLDGVWEGRDGGLLIVRGPRFRLQAAQGGHIEGRLQRRSDHITLHEPTTGSTRSYEMAMYQGRMVLRDEAGYTYLYRRLWLDERAFDDGAR
jgi:hypothetical protein